MNPYFIKSLSILNMLMIYFRDPLKILDQVKGPYDLVLYFLALTDKELFEVILVKNYSSILLFFIHGANIINVVLKYNIYVRKLFK